MNYSHLYWNFILTLFFEFFFPIPKNILYSKIKFNKRVKNRGIHIYIILFIEIYKNNGQKTHLRFDLVPLLFFFFSFFRLEFTFQNPFEE